MECQEKTCLCRRPLRLIENRVWRTYSGGRMIGEWRGRGEADTHWPEDWIGSTTRAVNAAHPGPEDEGLSRIDGKALGLTEDMLLCELIAADPAGMLGKKHAEHFGAQTALLVKALDAAERLAIQAHPDRADAMRYFGSPFGKTEAWYVLSTRGETNPPPAVLVGFRKDVTRAEWKRLFEEQDIPGMQNALHRIEVQPGDVILLEGGVPHAIGEGCFLIEIQEPTDYTLRVERTTPRGMKLTDMACHQGAGFEAMMDMFHYEFLSCEETLLRWRKQPRHLHRETGGCIDILIDENDTPCFRLERMQLSGEMTTPQAESFRIAVVVEGEGTLCSGCDTLSLRRGDCLFLPASLPECQWQGKMTILFCMPPRQL